MCSHVTSNHHCELTGNNGKARKMGEQTLESMFGQSDEMLKTRGEIEKSFNMDKIEATQKHQTFPTQVKYTV